MLLFAVHIVIVYFFRYDTGMLTLYFNLTVLWIVDIHEELRVLQAHKDFSIVMCITIQFNSIQ